jgi:eukaryotic-like serine/threonine-protein kinase
VLREGLAIRQKVSPGDWRTFNSMSRLGEAVLGQGRHAEAEPLIVHGYQGLQARQANIPERNRISLLEAARRVVRLYESWGKPVKADEWKRALGLMDFPADVFARP